MTQSNCQSVTLYFENVFMLNRQYMGLLISSELLNANFAEWFRNSVLRGTMDKV